MSAFVSTQVAVAANTPVRAVNSEDFSRSVSILDPVSEMRLAFLSVDAATGFLVRNHGPSGTSVGSFILPAEQEVWVYSGTATTVDVFVTEM